MYVQNKIIVKNAKGKKQQQQGISQRHPCFINARTYSGGAEML
jgi:hypothetical protein